MHERLLLLVATQAARVLPRLSLATILWRVHVPIPHFLMSISGNLTARHAAFVYVSPLCPCIPSALHV